MRASDAFGWIGGEEFLALWTSIDHESLREMNERLCLMIGKTPFSILGDELPVTISIGMTTTSGDETVDDTVARADKALYAAKADGRNRVECVLNEGLYEIPFSILPCKSGQTRRVALDS
jgi:diguanylate cyclase (GGDEF)-like protein